MNDRNSRLKQGVDALYIYQQHPSSTDEHETGAKMGEGGYSRVRAASGASLCPCQPVRFMDQFGLLVRVLLYLSHPSTLDRDQHR